MHNPSNVKRLTAWLSSRPSLEGITRSLVLDFLAAFNPVEAMFYYLDKNDEVTCLAAYGANDSQIGVSIASDKWRHWAKGGSFTVHSLSSNSVSWSEDKKRMIVNLYAQAVLVGFLMLGFAKSVDDVSELNAEAEAYSWSISLYLALHYHDTFGRSESAEIRRLANSAFIQHFDANVHLSERQLLILSGLIAEKTNNDIATELGYSVSTIRHETMRIFEVLNVSDRIEAAQRAKSFGIA